MSERNGCILTVRYGRNTIVDYREMLVILCASIVSLSNVNGFLFYLRNFNEYIVEDIHQDW